jgi:alkylation response protein AidB-like acyl-CoA dehydrogenase
LTFFGIDMRQPGIEPRPLVQMTGEAHFNEVFLNGATVPNGNVIGEVGGGWSVAMRTLGYERESLDADAEPGIQGRLDLSLPAGAYASGEISDGSDSYLPAGLESWELLHRMMQSNGLDRHPVYRDEAMRIYSSIRVASLTSRRFAAKSEPGAEVSLGKLASTELMRKWRDLALRCLGPAGQLLDGPGTFDGLAAKIALAVPGMSIAGGTDEIQRNIVGERVLGLPREPQVDRDKPFSASADPRTGDRP